MDGDPLNASLELCRLHYLLYENLFTYKFI
jgi:hypothetical protein